MIFDLESPLSNLDHLMMKPNAISFCSLFDEPCWKCCCINCYAEEDLNMGPGLWLHTCIWIKRIDVVHDQGCRMLGRHWITNRKIYSDISIISWIFSINHGGPLLRDINKIFCNRNCNRSLIYNGHHINHIHKLIRWFISSCRNLIKLIGENQNFISP